MSLLHLTVSKAFVHLPTPCTNRFPCDRWLCLLFQVPFHGRSPKAFSNGEFHPGMGCTKKPKNPRAHICPENLSTTRFCRYLKAKKNQAQQFLRQARDAWQFAGRPLHKRACQQTTYPSFPTIAQLNRVNSIATTL